jgi:hypothetical protein
MTATNRLPTFRKILRCHYRHFVRYNRKTTDISSGTTAKLPTFRQVQLLISDISSGDYRHFVRAKMGKRGKTRGGVILRFRKRP